MSNEVEYTLSLKDLVMTKLNEIEKKFDQVSESAERTDSTFKKISQAAAGYFAFDTLKNFAGSILDTAIKVDGLNNKLKYSEGSAEGASKRFEYLSGMSQKLGLSLESVTSGYSTIAAASRGTSMEGQTTTSIFEGISQAAATLGLTGEQAEGSLLAISQMMSKGKVSAEELRGQLSERLPGAFQLAAKSMGMTTGELDKFMADGKLMAEDFLPKFARELSNTFGASATENINTMGGAVNETKTNMFLMMKDLGEVFKPLMIEVSHIMTGLFKAVRESIPFFKEYGNVFAGVAATVGLSVIAFKAYTLWQSRAVISSSLLAAQTFITMVATDGLTLAFYAAGIGATAMWAAATLGLSLVVAGVIVAWNKFEGFRGAVVGIGMAFMQVFKNVGNFFAGIFDPIFKAWDMLKSGNITGAAGQIAKLGVNLLGAPVKAGLALINGDLTKGAVSEFNAGYDSQKDKKTVKSVKTLGGVSATKTMSASTGRGITADKNSKIARTYESKITNITIGKLVEGLTVKVMDTKEIAPRIKEEITKFLLTAVNDSNIIAN
jgi:tape measure domain-containing protein